MKFDEAFFDLQIRFARRVAALSGLPLERALLDYTNLYVRFALGRDFDPGHPVWQDYVAGAAGAADLTDWTWRFFLTRPRAEPPGLIMTSGCFSYARAAGGYARLHFEDAERDGRSPLHADRQAARLAELRALLEHLRRTQPDVHRLAGVSWLYNLAAYRRLFPGTYLATSKVAGQRFRNMPLWGQFLDRHGAIRKDAAGLLLERVARQPALDGLVLCFPLQPLAVEAPLSDFLVFHGLQPLPG